MALEITEQQARAIFREINGAEEGEELGFSETYFAEEIPEKNRELATESLYNILTDEKLHAIIGEDTEAVQNVKKALALIEKEDFDEGFPFLKYVENMYLYTDYDTERLWMSIEDTSEESVASVYDTDPYYRNYKLHSMFLNDVLPKIAEYMEAVTVQTEKKLSGKDTKLVLDIGGSAEFSYVNKEDFETYLDTDDKSVIMDKYQTEVEISANTDFENMVFLEESGSTPLSELPDYNEFLQEYKDSIEEAKETYHTIYNLTEHHSDLSNETVAVDVKTHSMGRIDEEDVKEKLMEQGYDKEEVEEIVDEDLVNKMVSRQIQNATGAFENTPNQVSYEGMTGRMGGHAVFKIEGISELEKDYEGYTVLDAEREGIEFERDGRAITAEPLKERIEEFSEWIEGLHTKLLNMEIVNVDTVAESIAEEYLLLPEEKQKINDEIEAEKARPQHIDREPTGNFRIDGTAWITHWGENKPPKGELGSNYIQMDTDQFYSDNLTPEVILNNLNDGQFGVQSIDGATDLCIEQEVKVTKTYEDDGSTVEWKEWDELVADATIIRDNQESMDEVQKQLDESGYTPLKPKPKEAEKEKKSAPEAKGKQKAPSKPKP